MSENTEPKQAAIYIPDPDRESIKKAIILTTPTGKAYCNTDCCYSGVPDHYNDFSHIDECYCPVITDCQSVCIDGIDGILSDLSGMLEGLGFDCEEFVSCFESGIFPLISGLMDQPPVFDASLAPLGCVCDESGGVTGKVFVCKLTNEETQEQELHNVLVNLDGTSELPYTGAWVDCDTKEKPCEPITLCFTGDNLPDPIEPYNYFSIEKPDCCLLEITTNAGTLKFGSDVKSYCSPEYKCPLTEFSIEVTEDNTEGQDCLSQIQVILENTGN